MLWLPVLVLMVGLVAGAVAREVPADPAKLNDVFPWLLGIGGAAAGAVLGLLIGGGDLDADGSQLGGLLGALLGGALGAAAFAALGAGHERKVEGNERSRQRSTPVSGARDPRTGASHGS